MEWKDITSVVGKAAPMLGTLVGGPAGAAIGGIIASVIGSESTPSAISEVLARDPEAAVKLAQIEADKSGKLAELVADQARAEIEAAAQAAAAVNATMQAEVASEHWQSYSWRPAIGFAVAVDLVAAVVVVSVAYVGVIFFGKDVTSLQHVPGMVAALAGLVGVASPILGIASWFRGKMQADPAIPTINRG